jgi:protein-S-isoprenylcysteine O-methyltransferase Ste14
LKSLEDLLSEMPKRRLADLLLFGVTLAELVALAYLVPAFTIVDWIYILQHLLVLGIALTRRAPAAQDRSLPTSLAVAVSITYPYAQVIYLHWIIGNVAWPEGGLILVTLSACLSLASLLSIGRLFGFRPALRGLATSGPYGFVRHPMYLSYLLSDIGYNLQEWNIGTVLLVLVGWASLIYRIAAEERVLSQDAQWQTYVSSVPYRLLPGVW